MESIQISSVARRRGILSLASQIEELDQRMQTALEAGSFTTARELAEEQEALLSMLMLIQERR
jgi:uncharacterized protein YeaC (DUF1315 family)